MLLKDLDEQGWWFTSSTESAKGEQLRDRPAAALCFFWPQVGRQVRVWGHVVRDASDRATRYFRARPTGSRAGDLASRQSALLDSREKLLGAVGAAHRRLVAEPDLVPDHRSLSAVGPSTVELWQASDDRLHTRLEYRRSSGSWSRSMLWP